MDQDLLLLVCVSNSYNVGNSIFECTATSTTRKSHAILIIHHNSVSGSGVVDAIAAFMGNLFLLHDVYFGYGISIRWHRSNVYSSDRSMATLAESSLEGKSFKGM